MIALVLIIASAFIGVVVATNFSIQTRIVHAPSEYNVVLESGDFNMTSVQLSFPSLNEIDVYMSVQNMNATYSASGNVTVKLENAYGSIFAWKEYYLTSIAPLATQNILFNFTGTDIVLNFSSALVVITG